VREPGLRFGEVVDGRELAGSRRAGVPDRDLARGPARLAKMLALGRDQNAIDTLSTGSAFVARAPIRDPSTGSSGAVVRARPRVGVSGPGGDVAAYPALLARRGGHGLGVSARHGQTVETAALSTGRQGHAAPRPSGQ
jgi:hypothetical protein